MRRESAEGSQRLCRSVTRWSNSSFSTFGTISTQPSHPTTYSRFPYLESSICLSPDEDIGNFDNQGPIIAVIGRAGAGKSAFIRVATGSNEIDGDLPSPVSEIKVTRCYNPLRGGNICFLDTPGFDDILSVTDILQTLAGWLENVQLSGILYLHRITDNSMANPLFDNLDLLQKICGEDVGSNIRLVTTCWDLLPQDLKFQGEMLETRLFGESWKQFILSGAQMHRFQSTASSAWKIINSIPMNRRPLQIQEEVKHEKMTPRKSVVSLTTSVFRNGILRLKLITKTITKPQAEKLRNAMEDELHSSLFVSRFNQGLSNGPSSPIYKRACSLLSEIVKLPATAPLLTDLKAEDAQCMVDFLNKSLQDIDVPGSQILYLMSRLAKSAQVFPSCFKLQGVQCNFNDQPFSEGGFGSIYKAALGSQPVCVKVIRPDIDRQELKAHVKELMLWAHTSHQNIIPFYGVYLPAGPSTRTCLVSPWIENGDLREYITAHPKTPRLPFIADIISGLKYLHGVDIIHGDLKAKNVLVSSTKRAMLTDFGISRISMSLSDTTRPSMCPGSPYWMAPELILQEGVLPTRESDIWSFACTCYEVITGETPFSRYKTIPQLTCAFLKGGAVPIRPPSCEKQTRIEKKLWKMMKRCWTYKPSRRPSAERIQRLLDSFDFIDDRPSPEPVLQMWTRVFPDTHIDYDRVYEILNRIRLTCSENIIERRRST